MYEARAFGMKKNLLRLASHDCLNSGDMLVSMCLLVCMASCRISSLYGVVGWS